MQWKLWYEVNKRHHSSCVCEGTGYQYLTGYYLLLITNNYTLLSPPLVNVLQCWCPHAATSKKHQHYCEQWGAYRCVVHTLTSFLPSIMTIFIVLWPCTSDNFGGQRTLAYVSHVMPCVSHNRLAYVCRKQCLTCTTFQLYSNIIDAPPSCIVYTCIIIYCLADWKHLCIFFHDAVSMYYVFAD